MAKTQCKVQWFPATNPTGEPVTLTDDITSLIVRRGKDVKTNVFNFDLRNPKLKSSTIIHGKYIDPINGLLNIQADDLVKIWIKRNQDGSAITDSDFLMTGKVKQPSINSGENSTVLKIQGTDNSYTLLNKIWPKSYPSQQIYQTVIDVVQQLTSPTDGSADASNPSSLDIDAQAGGATPDTVNNKYVTSVRKSTAEDGSVNPVTTFPSRPLANYMKPAYEYLNMLSSPEMTNTDDELDGTDPVVYSRQFLWWVDEFNRFHWFYPDDDVDSTLTVGTDQEIRSYSIKEQQFESFNLVFWNAGKDDGGTAMKGYLFNRNTKLSDLKIKHIPFLDVGKEQRDRNGLTGATLLAAVKKDVEIRINALFNQTAKDKFKGTITLYGAKYNVGDKVKLIDVWKGINIDLRITGVTYNFDSKSLITQLDVEEDEDKLISLLS